MRAWYTTTAAVPWLPQRRELESWSDGAVQKQQQGERGLSAVLGGSAGRKATPRKEASKTPAHATSECPDLNPRRPAGAQNLHSSVHKAHLACSTAESGRKHSRLGEKGSPRCTKSAFPTKKKNVVISQHEIRTRQIAGRSFSFFFFLTSIIAGQKFKKAKSVLLLLHYSSRWLSLQQCVLRLRRVLVECLPVLAYVPSNQHATSSAFTHW